jgi:hypothetical protein
MQSKLTALIWRNSCETCGEFCLHSRVSLKVGEGHSRSPGAAGRSVELAGTAPGCLNRRSALGVAWLPQERSPIEAKDSWSKIAEGQNACRSWVDFDPLKQIQGHTEIISERGADWITVAE